MHHFFWGRCLNSILVVHSCVRYFWCTCIQCVLAYKNSTLLLFVVQLNTLIDWQPQVKISNDSTEECSCPIMKRNWRESPMWNDWDALRKIWAKPLKETTLCVAWAVFDSYKIPPWNGQTAFLYYHFACNPKTDNTPRPKSLIYTPKGDNEDPQQIHKGVPPRVWKKKNK